MPVLTPHVPDGLIDLMKALTKCILKEKPENIYEFAVQNFEKLIIERDGSLDKGYEIFRSEAIYFQSREKYEKHILKSHYREGASNNSLTYEIDTNDLEKDNQLSLSAQRRLKARKLSSRKPSEPLIAIKEEDDEEAIKNEIESEMQRRERAAFKIQKAFKGFLERVRPRKQGQMSEQVAALIIQRTLRTLFTRRLKEKQIEEEQVGISSGKDTLKSGKQVRQCSTEDVINAHPAKAPHRQTSDNQHPSIAFGERCSENDTAQPMAFAESILENDKTDPEIVEKGSFSIKGSSSNLLNDEPPPVDLYREQEDLVKDTEETQSGSDRLGANQAPEKQEISFQTESLEKVMNEAAVTQKVPLEHERAEKVMEDVRVSSSKANKVLITKDISVEQESLVEIMGEARIGNKILDANKQLEGKDIVNVNVKESLESNVLQEEEEALSDIAAPEGQMKTYQNLEGQNDGISTNSQEGEGNKIKSAESEEKTRTASLETPVVKNDENQTNEKIPSNNETQIDTPGVSNTQGEIVSHQIVSQSSDINSEALKEETSNEAIGPADSKSDKTNSSDTKSSAISVDEAKPPELKSADDISAGFISAAEYVDINSAEIRHGEVESAEIKPVESLLTGIHSAERESTENRSGNVKSGQDKSGEETSGEDKSSKAKSGEDKHADTIEVNCGEVNSGEANSGKVNPAEVNYGEVNSDEVNSGEVNSGKVNSAEVNSGEVNFGKSNSEEVNSGLATTDKVNSGKIKSLEPFHVDSKSADTYFAETKLAETKSAEHGSEEIPSMEPISTMANSAAEVKFSEAESIGTKTAEIKHDGTQKAEAKSADNKPAAIKAEEIKFPEIQSIATHPGDTISIEGKPPAEIKSPVSISSHINSAEVKSPETTQVDTSSSEHKIDEVESGKAKPAEVISSSAQPAEVKPADIQQDNAKPTEAEPAEVEPAEIAPAEVKPAEAKRSSIKPAEVKPAEVKPAEVKPSEIGPTEITSTDIKPGNTKPAGIKPTAAVKPSEATSAEIKSIEANSEETNLSLMQPSIKLQPSLSAERPVKSGTNSEEQQSLMQVLKDQKKFIHEERKNSGYPTASGFITQKGGSTSEDITNSSLKTHSPEENKESSTANIIQKDNLSGIPDSSRQENATNFESHSLSSALVATSVLGLVSGPVLKRATDGSLDESCLDHAENDLNEQVSAQMIELKYLNQVELMEEAKRGIPESVEDPNISQALKEANLVSATPDKSISTDRLESYNETNESSKEGGILESIHSTPVGLSVEKPTTSSTSPQENLTGGIATPQQGGTGFDTHQKFTEEFDILQQKARGGLKKENDGFHWAEASRTSEVDGSSPNVDQHNVEHSQVDSSKGSKEDVSKILSSGNEDSSYSKESVVLDEEPGKVQKEHPITESNEPKTAGGMAKTKEHDSYILKDQKGSLEATQERGINEEVTTRLSIEDIGEIQPTSYVVEHNEDPSIGCEISSVISNFAEEHGASEINAATSTRAKRSVDMDPSNDATDKLSKEMTLDQNSLIESLRYFKAKAIVTPGITAAEDPTSDTSEDKKEVPKITDVSQTENPALEKEAKRDVKGHCSAIAGDEQKDITEEPKNEHFCGSDDLHAAAEKYTKQDNPDVEMLPLQPTNKDSSTTKEEDIGKEELGTSITITDNLLKTESTSAAEKDVNDTAEHQVMIFGDGDTKENDAANLNPLIKTPQRTIGEARSTNPTGKAYKLQENAFDTVEWQPIEGDIDSIEIGEHLVDALSNVDVDSQHCNDMKIVPDLINCDDKASDLKPKDTSVELDVVNDILKDDEEAVKGDRSNDANRILKDVPDFKREDGMKDENNLNESLIIEDDQNMLDNESQKTENMLLSDEIESSKSSPKATEEAAAESKKVSQLTKAVSQDVLNGPEEYKDTQIDDTKDEALLNDYETRAFQKDETKESEESFSKYNSISGEEAPCESRIFEKTESSQSIANEAQVDNSFYHDHMKDEVQNIPAKDPMNPEDKILIGKDSEKGRSLVEPNSLEQSISQVESPTKQNDELDLSSTGKIIFNDADEDLSKDVIMPPGLSTQKSADKLETHAEVKPAEVKPSDIKLGEARLAEVRPAEIEPAEVKPAGIKSSKTKPGVIEPAAEAKRADVKHSIITPTEIEPAAEVKASEIEDVKPADLKPGNHKPAEINPTTLVKPGETKPTEIKPSKAPAAEIKPIEANSEETNSSWMQPSIKKQSSLSAERPVKSSINSEEQQSLMQVLKDQKMFICEERKNSGYATASGLITQKGALTSEGIINSSLETQLAEESKESSSPNISQKDNFNGIPDSSRQEDAINSESHSLSSALVATSVLGLVSEPILKHTTDSSLDESSLHHTEDDFKNQLETQGIMEQLQTKSNVISLKDEIPVELRINDDVPLKIIESTSEEYSVQSQDSIFDLPKGSSTLSVALEQLNPSIINHVFEDIEELDEFDPASSNEDEISRGNAETADISLVSERTYGDDQPDDAEPFKTEVDSQEQEDVQRFLRRSDVETQDNRNPDGILAESFVVHKSISNRVPANSVSDTETNEERDATSNTDQKDADGVGGGNLELFHSPPDSGVDDDSDSKLDETEEQENARTYKVISDGKNIDILILHGTPDSDWLPNEDLLDDDSKNYNPDDSADVEAPNEAQLFGVKQLTLKSQEDEEAVGLNTEAKISRKKREAHLPTDDDILYYEDVNLEEALTPEKQPNRGVKTYNAIITKGLNNIASTDQQVTAEKDDEDIEQFQDKDSSWVRESKAIDINDSSNRNEQKESSKVDPFQHLLVQIPGDPLCDGAKTGLDQKADGKGIHRLGGSTFVEDATKKKFPKSDANPFSKPVESGEAKEDEDRDLTAMTPKGFSSKKESNAKEHVTGHDSSSLLDRHNSELEEVASHTKEDIFEDLTFKDGCIRDASPERNEINNLDDEAYVTDSSIFTIKSESSSVQPEGSVNAFEDNFVDEDKDYEGADKNQDEDAVTENSSIYIPQTNNAVETDVTERKADLEKSARKSPPLIIQDQSNKEDYANPSSNDSNVSDSPQKREQSTEDENIDATQAIENDLSEPKEEEASPGSDNIPERQVNLMERFQRLRFHDPTPILAPASIKPKFSSEEIAISEGTRTALQQKDSESKLAEISQGFSETNMEASLHDQTFERDLQEGHDVHSGTSQEKDPTGVLGRENNISSSDLLVGSKEQERQLQASHQMKPIENSGIPSQHSLDKSSTNTPEEPKASKDKQEEVDTHPTEESKAETESMHRLSGEKNAAAFSSLEELTEITPPIEASAAKGEDNAEISKQSPELSPIDVQGKTSARIKPSKHNLKQSSVTISEEPHASKDKQEELGMNPIEKSKEETESMHSRAEENNVIVPSTLEELTAPSMEASNTKEEDKQSPELFPIAKQGTSSAKLTPSKHNLDQSSTNTSEEPKASKDKQEQAGTNPSEKPNEEAESMHRLSGEKNVAASSSLEELTETTPLMKASNAKEEDSAESSKRSPEQSPIDEQKQLSARIARDDSNSSRGDDDKYSSSPKYSSSFEGPTDSEDSLHTVEEEIVKKKDVRCLTTGDDTKLLLTTGETMSRTSEVQIEEVSAGDTTTIPENLLENASVNQHPDDLLDKNKVKMSNVSKKDDPLLQTDTLVRNNNSNLASSNMDDSKSVEDMENIAAPNEESFKRSTDEGRNNSFASANHLKEDLSPRNDEGVDQVDTKIDTERLDSSKSKHESLLYSGKPTDLSKGVIAFEENKISVNDTSMLGEASVEPDEAKIETLSGDPSIQLMPNYTSNDPISNSTSPFKGTAHNKNPAQCNQQEYTKETTSGKGPFEPPPATSLELEKTQISPIRNPREERFNKWMIPRSGYARSEEKSETKKDIAGSTDLVTETVLPSELSTPYDSLNEIPSLQKDNDSLDEVPIIQTDNIDSVLPGYEKDYQTSSGISGTNDLKQIVADIDGEQGENSQIHEEGSINPKTIAVGNKLNDVSTVLQQGCDPKSQKDSETGEPITDYFESTANLEAQEKVFDSEGLDNKETLLQSKENLEASSSKDTRRAIKSNATEYDEQDDSKKAHKAEFAEASLVGVTSKTSPNFMEENEVPRGLDDVENSLEMLTNTNEIDDKDHNTSVSGGTNGEEDASLQKTSFFKESEMHTTEDTKLSFSSAPPIHSTDKLDTPSTTKEREPTNLDAVESQPQDHEIKQDENNEKDKINDQQDSKADDAPSSMNPLQIFNIAAGTIKKAFKSYEDLKNKIFQDQDTNADTQEPQSQQPINGPVVETNNELNSGSQSKTVWFVGDEPIVTTIGKTVETPEDSEATLAKGNPEVIELSEDQPSKSDIGSQDDNASWHEEVTSISSIHLEDVATEEEKETGTVPSDTKKDEPPVSKEVEESILIYSDRTLHSGIASKADFHSADLSEGGSRPLELPDDTENRDENAFTDLTQVLSEDTVDPKSTLPNDDTTEVSTMNLISSSTSENIMERSMINDDPSENISEIQQQEQRQDKDDPSAPELNEDDLVDPEENKSDGLLIIAVEGEDLEKEQMQQLERDTLNVDTLQEVEMQNEINNDSHSENLDTKSQLIFLQTSEDVTEDPYGEINEESTSEPLEEGDLSKIASSETSTTVNKVISIISSSGLVAESEKQAVSVEVDTKVTDEPKEIPATAPGENGKEKSQKESPRSDVENIDISIYGEDSLEAMYYSLRKHEVLLDKMHKQASECRSASSERVQLDVVNEGSNAEKVVDAVVTNTKEDKIALSSTEEVSKEGEAKGDALTTETNQDLSELSVDIVPPSKRKLSRNESYYTACLSRPITSATISPRTKAEHDSENPIELSKQKTQQFIHQLHSSQSIDDVSNDDFRRNILAYSVSEADSDYCEPGERTNAIFNDFNISTAFEHTPSTDTDSTIVSAATKIQAGARGFLTRRRLRRASEATLSFSDRKPSFGNDAIGESLEDLIDEEDAARRIQKSFRRYRDRRARQSAPTLLNNAVETDSSKSSSNSSGEAIIPIIDIKVEQKSSASSTNRESDTSIGKSKGTQDVDSSTERQSSSDNVESSPYVSEENKQESEASFDGINLAARRMTLQRGDAVQRNSTGEEDSSSLSGTGSSNQSDEILGTHPKLPPRAKSSGTERRGKVLERHANLERAKRFGTRQRTMPVQIDFEILRVLPKHLRKRIRSADQQNKPKSEF